MLPRTLYTSRQPSWRRILAPSPARCPTLQNMTTGLSLVRFARYWGNLIYVFKEHTETIYLKRKERREKAKKRLKTKKEKPVNRAPEIKINPSKSKPTKTMPAPKQEVFDFMKTKAGFQLPSFNLLKSSSQIETAV